MALATVQIEVAKLAQLWVSEVVQRRKLQDEYDRPKDTVQTECVRKYASADDPLFLFPTSAFEAAGDYLFVDRREILHAGLLDADPMNWGKQTMPFILSFIAKRCADG